MLGEPWRARVNLRAVSLRWAIWAKGERLLAGTAPASLTRPLLPFRSPEGNPEHAGGGPRVSHQALGEGGEH